MRHGEVIWGERVYFLVTTRVGGRGGEEEEEKEEKERVSDWWSRQRRRLCSSLSMDARATMSCRHVPCECGRLEEEGESNVDGEKEKVGEGT